MTSERPQLKIQSNSYYLQEEQFLINFGKKCFWWKLARKITYILNNSEEARRLNPKAEKIYFFGGIQQPLSYPIPFFKFLKIQNPPFSISVSNFLRISWVEGCLECEDQERDNRKLFVWEGDVRSHPIGWGPVWSLMSTNGKYLQSASWPSDGWLRVTHPEEDDFAKCGKVKSSGEGYEM